MEGLGRGLPAQGLLTLASPTVDFSLYLITDRGALPRGRTLEETVREACAGGVRAIQLREKDLSARELLPLAERLREITAGCGARLLINDRVDVALAVHADGVHLGGHSLPVAAARALLGPEKLIGVSTHHPFEIAVAGRAGADFATFGPVFATPSKAAFGPPQGLGALREACGASSLPVFALGGITPANLASALETGARGVALIRPVIASPQPAAACRNLLACLPRQE